MILIGYFIACIFFGTIYPWIMAWWVFIVLFIIGFAVINLKTENQFKKSKKFIKLYLQLTPVVATLIGGIDIMYGNISSGAGTPDLPGSANFALMHSFLMWAVVSFIFGGVVRYSKEMWGKINSENESKSSE